tara:strand:+ start:1144 stop:2604 length:1461 start_codon:yes stop_codon:yes gene_type:complete
MGQINPVFGAVIPSQTQLALQNNYLNFAGGANDFAQQYLPEIYEQEVERYGNRTLNGFLRMVGAEMPMTSDQVIWSEQNRLHISYNNVNLVGPGAGTAIFNIPTNAGTIQNAIAPNDTIVVMNPLTGVTVKGIVGAVAGGAGVTTNVTAYPFTVANWDALGIANNGLKLFVYGSLFAKGTASGNFSVQPQFTQFNNQPIIIKDRYQINGSDMAQIGWVEVATEDGTSGYLWYLKSESETRLRFDDYLEMAMIEGELATGAGGVSFAAQAAAGNVPGFTAAINAHGTQGLFAAIQQRGNVMTGYSGGTGISDFDQVLKNLDTQGAIEENMLFLNRDMDLDFDDMLAQISSGPSGGVAYGIFENSEDMALNLGFSGFRRGSYDFYKTSWKYLNDASTRGAVSVSNIDGVLIPAGTSTVYDQILGTNIRRPFLHVRYRASQGDDRRYKNWVTGTAGGAYTSELDSMIVNWLSERCLITQAANNFVLFQA